MSQQQQNLFDNVEQVTHENWDAFNASLSKEQAEMSAIKTHGKLWYQLVQLWEDNPDIRMEVGWQANEYWRQYTYNNTFFDLHYGQQLHVLAYLLKFLTAFRLNESMKKFKK